MNNQHASKTEKQKKTIDYQNIISLIESSTRLAFFPTNLSSMRQYGLQLFVHLVLIQEFEVLREQLRECVVKLLELLLKEELPK